MEQIQTDQPEKCTRCHEFPEDILMLACNHDLCLLCAATIFTAPENAIPRQNSALRCEQCGSLTQLDSSSILELEKLVPNTRMNQSQQLRISSNTPQSITPSRGIGVSGSTKNEILSKYKIEKKSYEYQPLQPLQQSRYQEKVPLNSMISSANKKQKQYCPSHPDEKVSYFCYDCLTNCICPECVIHGTHKNHNVGTVKKAYPVILKKMEDKIDEMNGKIRNVKEMQEKFNQRKIEVIEQGRVKKKQICDAFNELRTILDKKEKELIENQGNSEQEFLRFLEMDFNMIASKIGQFHTNIETISSQINQREQVKHIQLFILIIIKIGLLNFFSEQNKSSETNAQNDEQFLKKIQGDFEESQNKKTFDSNATLAQINQMILSIQINEPQQQSQLQNTMKNSYEFVYFIIFVNFQQGQQDNQSNDIRKSNQSFGNKYISDNKSNQ